MATTQELTGAPIDYEGMMISPLDFNDWAYYEEWAKQRIVEVAAKAIEDGGIGAATAQVLLDKALERASRMYFLHPDCISQIKTTAGMIRIVWLSLRHTQPDLTLEDLQKKFEEDPDLPRRLTDKITEISEGNQKEMIARAEKKSDNGKAKTESPIAMPTTIP